MFQTTNQPSHYSCPPRSEFPLPILRWKLLHSASKNTHGLSEVWGTPTKVIELIGIFQVSADWWSYRLYSFIGILIILLWPVIRGILCESWSVHITRSNQNGQNTKDHQKLATMTRVTEFYQLQLDRTKVTKYVRTNFTSHASRQLLPIHHHSSDVAVRSL